EGVVQQQAVDLKPAMSRERLGLYAEHPGGKNTAGGQKIEQRHGLEDTPIRLRIPWAHSAKYRNPAPHLRKVRSVGFRGLPPGSRTLDNCRYVFCAKPPRGSPERQDNGGRIKETSSDGFRDRCHAERPVSIWPEDMFVRRRDPFRRETPPGF